MVEVYVDGSSLGNPGRVGIGYIIYSEGKLIKEESLCLGVQTNNFAEYMAFIFSLVDVLNCGYKTCRVYSDSQLVCEQIKGKYKVKNKNIFPLYLLVKKIISGFEKFEVTHIEREKNTLADKLAKKGASALENLRI